MQKNGHHNKVGGSEASTGMASTPPKRRGRAQRRVSCEMRSWGGSWFLGYVRRRDEIATEKIAAAARRTIPEGSRTTFVVGAYSFGANFPVQPPNFPSQPVPTRLRILVCHDTLACTLSRSRRDAAVQGHNWRLPLCALGEAETLRCLAIDSDYRCAAAF